MRGYRVFDGPGWTRDLHRKRRLWCQPGPPTRLGIDPVKASLDSDAARPILRPWQDNSDPWGSTASKSKQRLGKFFTLTCDFGWIPGWSFVTCSLNFIPYESPLSHFHHSPLCSFHRFLIFRWIIRVFASSALSTSSCSDTIVAGVRFNLYQKECAGQRRYAPRREDTGTIITSQRTVKPTGTQYYVCAHSTPMYISSNTNQTTLRVIRRLGEG